MVCRFSSEWLVLLPESLPFVYELLEFEDPLVESECQTFSALVKEISGESLESYLEN